jgi:hypothetical protein
VTWLAVAISIFATAVVVLYFGFFGISHLIDYEPGSRGINFHLFRVFTIFELKYEMIERCETRKLSDFGWFDRRLSTLFLTLTIGGWPRLTRVMLKMKARAHSGISSYFQETRPSSQTKCKETLTRTRTCHRNIRTIFEHRVCKRILALTKSYLLEVGRDASRWNALYRDPNDGDTGN